MIQNTSINSTPIKPNFSRRDNRTELLRETTDLIKTTGSLDNVDENTMQRIKGIVEGIDVNPDSKIMGPLKTFVLTGISLATGALLSRGTANKCFYMVKDKGFAQEIFSKMGAKMGNFTENIARKAENTEGMKAVKKYSLQTINYLTQKTNALAEKGVKAEKDTQEFITAKAENLVKKTVQTVGSAVGLTTTGAALAVDKDKNGKSDMLEFKERKSEQQAVTELAAAVLEAI